MIHEYSCNNKTSIKISYFDIIIRLKGSNTCNLFRRLYLLCLRDGLSILRTYKEHNYTLTFTFFFFCYFSIWFAIVFQFFRCIRKQTNSRHWCKKNKEKNFFDLLPKGKSLFFLSLLWFGFALFLFYETLHYRKWKFFLWD